MVLSNFQKVFWSLSLTLNGLNLPAIALYHSFFLKKKSQANQKLIPPWKTSKKRRREHNKHFSMILFLHTSWSQENRTMQFLFLHLWNHYVFLSVVKKKSKALMMQSCNEKCGQLHVNTSQAYISFSLSLHYNECIRLSPWYRFSTSQKAHLHFSRPASQHWKKKIYLLMQLPAYYLLYGVARQLLSF